MFALCDAITEVPLFDTTKAESAFDMFINCTALTYIPAFNMPNVTIVDRICYNCYNVQYGALALYNQFASMEEPPAHDTPFRNCGINTVTGAAELAQIPDDWK